MSKKDPFFDYEDDESSGENEFFHDIEHGIFEGIHARPDVPPMYHVLLMQDVDTPFDFMVFVLETFFYYNHEDATLLSEKIDQEEIIVCGLYPRDVAESKILSINNYAISQNIPLTCVMQRDKNYVVR